MKRSHRPLTIIALLGVGLCVVVYRAGPTAPAPAVEHGTATPKPPPGESSAAASELADLRRELFELKRVVRTQGHEPVAAEPAAPAAPDPRTDPEARADYERRYREHMAGVEAAFRQEAADPRWSSATAATVQSALAADSDLRPLARGVECRSRTCRLELADDGSGKLGKILPVFAQQVGRELPSIAYDRIVDASGTATMVLYMARQDDALARAP